MTILEKNAERLGLAGKMRATTAASCLSEADIPLVENRDVRLLD